MAESYEGARFSTCHTICDLWHYNFFTCDVALLWYNVAGISIALLTSLECDYVDRRAEVINL